MELLKLFANDETKNAPGEVLNKYAKLRTAVHESARNLSPLIDAVEGARTDLAALEVAVALDEATPDAVSQAERRATEAKKRLDAAGEKVARLRSGMVGLAHEVWAARCRIKDSLPAHGAALRAAFSVEWQSALETFQRALNRRSGLEAIFRQRLDLPEPITGVVSESAALSVDQAPWRQFEALESCVAEIMSPKRIAAEVLRYPPDPINGINGGAKFDPDEIYTLVRGVEGLDAGVKVIERSLSPNMLRLLYNTGGAVRFVAPTEEQGLAILQQADEASEEAAIREASHRPKPQPERILTEEQKRALAWDDNYQTVSRRA